MINMNLEVFKGRLPYASELFGVYQPLLGWKSKIIQRRLEDSPLSLTGFPRVFAVKQRDRIEVQQGQDKVVLIDGNGDIIPEGTPDVFKNDAIPFLFDPPEHLDSLIVRVLQREVEPWLRQNPPSNKAFWQSRWDALLTKDNLNAALRRAIDEVSGQDRNLFAPKVVDPADRLGGYVARTRTLFASTAEAADYLFNKEAQVARFLNGLLPTPGDAASEAAFPDNANALLLRVRPEMDYAKALRLLDPMTFAGGKGREAVLSPLGMVHIYRQYFFEFSTFLGAPVEHIWLSPGATTELIEVSTRRVLQERTFEEFAEKILRSEVTTTNQDELATAVRDENQKNTKLGSSITGGATILIAHVEASGSVSVEETQKRAREENQKTMRQQTAKLSSEIRSNFKSSFRTVTETTDTRSKRYVIQNPSNALVNYELRRKMRQVGVQVQDIGTQLCWQVYIDDPGVALGVGQLVHLASKADLSQYAALPTKPTPEDHTEVLTILLPVPRPGQRSDLGPIAAAGFIGLTMGSLPGAAVGVAAYEVLDSLFGGDEEEHDWYSIDPVKTIHQPYKLTLPEGYQIAPAAQQKEDEVFKKAPGINESIPLHWLGKNGMHLKYHMTTVNPTDGIMDLSINGGDVTPGEIIEFQVQITITPTAAKKAAIVEENKAVAEENKKREVERERRIKEELVKSVKERVKFASEIKARKFEDLREEERTVVYRRLIEQLMRDAWSLSADRPVAHLRSELIKALFDVDKMMYFVAPEWWQPRRHKSGLQTGVDIAESPKLKAAIAKTTAASQSIRPVADLAARSRLGTLGGEDIVGWGGEGRPDNYMITEDSAPARLGSSLGWLIQLDGDNLRNAFLNAPWVKAVIPIRPGHELEAFEWLKQSAVEGTDGLGETYAGEDRDLLKQKYFERHNVAKDPTVDEVLVMIAEDVQAKHEKSLQVVTEQNVAYLPPDEVFEKGFDPLSGGFRATWKEHFEFVDQWVEILPTDQIVAVEVEYDPKTGLLKD
ncbi:hypothetical protein [Sinorhizobium meliloti]|uniref:hypothetical protein n=1 Tax=Rhizobium meliloti TaxID=382 RepID=UPI0020916298|nr:hypothetical protein [Sinorhizobium meliloti]MCO5965371.1 hypothetical protein [Sinorhizobium meliloti]